MRSCTILILNWNGRDLLAQGLPSVIDAVSVTRKNHEILVVDNGSTDGSVEFVKSSFPSVRVVALEKNHGFGEGNNIGVQNAAGDIVVLLNNDMVVDRNFLSPLLEAFETEVGLFAAACQIFFQDSGKRREETGKTFSYWDHGIIRYLHQDVTQLDCERKYVPVSWAGGGAAAFDRKKFLELGGFRSIYSPAYVEDTDLSYRARKRGWGVVFAPASIVYHKHRASSTKRYGEEDLEILIRRNQLFFLWANISDRKMFVEHLLSHPFRVLKHSRNDLALLDWRALRQALPRFLEARKMNRRERKLAMTGDEQLLGSWVWRREYLRLEKKLSILFVCPYVPCLGIHAGGARMYRIIEGMSKRHDASVLVYTETDNDEPLVETLESFCVKVIAIRRGQSLNEPDWFHIKPYRAAKEFANPEMKRTLMEEIRSGRYDIVQFEYLEMGYLGREVRKLNVPMIMTNHEVQSRNVLHSIQYGRYSILDKLQLVYDWMIMLNFEIRVSRWFDLLVVLTDTDCKALQEYAPSLPLVVHNTGVDVSYFSSYNHLPLEAHSMVFVGYYRHFPNDDAMKFFCGEIFPLIREVYADAKIYIVGAEPTADLRRLHDDESVIVTGRVDDIRPYIARSAVYVVPLRLGAGIRGKILEAWAMKKPVVATSVASSGLEAEAGRNLLLADDPREFAAQVMRLFQDTDFSQRLGEEGYRTTEKLYDWPAQVERHEEIYYKLLRHER
jgi:GT2 family glycosyltransferase